MRSIKFNDEMVRMILSGNKTQTRRPLKHVPEGRVDNYRNIEKDFWKPFCKSLLGGEDLLVGNRIKCPFGKVGDRLWVKEAYSFDENLKPIYRDDGVSLEKGISWNSPSTMLKWNSRITLEITDIRVERVQEISPEDAIREGAREFLDLPPSSPYGQDDRWSMGSPTRTGQCLGSPIMAFANAWNSIYEKKGFGWHVNPWAWVIEFKIKDKS